MVREQMKTKTASCLRMEELPTESTYAHANFLFTENLFSLSFEENI